MRRCKYPKIGSLVLITRWSDAKFEDPFRVGTLEGISITKACIRYFVSGSSRSLGHCFLITEEAVAWKG